MARAPRSHPLDRMAEDAFRFLIPHHWCFRRSGRDCGVGSEVEIGDAAGHAALRCYVQLSGVRAPDLTEALRLRLPEETIECYRSLDPPVLMVRHHLPSGQFFSRWAHQLDSRHRSPGGARSRRNATAFTWASSDRWNDRAPGRIERDLRLMRELRAPGFSWPMRFTLDVEADAGCELVKAEIGSALRRQWTAMSRYVVLVDDAAQAHGSITISPRMVRAAIGRFPTVTVRLNESCSHPRKLDSVLADLLVLIAIALTRAGYVEVAARLCQLCFGEML